MTVTGKIKMCIFYDIFLLMLKVLDILLLDICSSEMFGAMHNVIWPAGKSKCQNRMVDQTIMGSKPPLSASNLYHFINLFIVEQMSEKRF